MVDECRTKCISHFLGHPGALDGDTAAFTRQPPEPRTGSSASAGSEPVWLSEPQQTRSVRIEEPEKDTLTCNARLRTALRFWGQSGFLEALAQQFQELTEELAPENSHFLGSLVHSGQLHAERDLAGKRTWKRPFSPPSSGRRARTHAVTVETSAQKRAPAQVTERSCRLCRLCAGRLTSPRVLLKHSLMTHDFCYRRCQGHGPTKRADPQRGRRSTRTLPRGSGITSGEEPRRRENRPSGKLPPRLFGGSLYLSRDLTCARCCVDGTRVGYLFHCAHHSARADDNS